MCWLRYTLLSGIRCVSAAWLFGWTCLFLAACCPAQAAAAQGLTPDINAEKLVENLPWSFYRNQENLTGENFPYIRDGAPPQSLTLFRFSSKNPIDQGRGGKTFLRLQLYTGSYSSSEEAAKQFKHIQKSINPDTGLSYQWDLVILNGQLIYLLHADCLLAEEHFVSLHNTLKEMMDNRESSQQSLLFCQCGGSCRPSP